MAKRNGKTKPPQQRMQQRVYGELDPDDSFAPPDRPDQVSLSETENQPVEVIDFRKGTAENAADQGGGDGGGDEDEAPELRLRERAQPQQRPQQQARDADRDERLSRTVQKRIQRERNITNRERQLREQAETKLANEVRARQALDDRMLRVERTQKQVDANGDLKALKAERDALVPQIAAATEAGDTKQALALQIKHGELQTKIGVMEYDLTLRAENARNVEAQEAEARRRQQQQGGDTSQQVHPSDQAENIERGNDFKKHNRHWWRRNAEAREFSIEEDKKIIKDIADGVCEFEPYSDEHFEELADRMHEEFPDLELCDLEGEPYTFDEDEEQGGGNARREARVQNNGRRVNGNGRPPQGRNGSSVRGNRQPDEVENARLGRITLTQADYDQMRKFKLDPNNPAHKRQFAKERARSILADANRGAQ